MLKLTDDDFNRLVAYMKKNYGINLDKKRILIEGRLSNMVAQRGFKSFKEFIDFAFADRTGNETMQLVNDDNCGFVHEGMETIGKCDVCGSYFKVHTTTFNVK